jgi:hypothetical protein
MYTNSSSNGPLCRAENIRFKADIIRMPADLINWHKVGMNNWTQYCSEINGSRCISINNANHPTIEFILSPIDGEYLKPRGAICANTGESHS